MLSTMVQPHRRWVWMKTLGVDQTNPERMTRRESTALDTKSCTLCNGPPIFDSSARSSMEIEWSDNQKLKQCNGNLFWGVRGLWFPFFDGLASRPSLSPPIPTFLFPTIAIFKQPSLLNHCIPLNGTVGSAKHWFEGFWVFCSAISNLDAKCLICFQR